MAYYRSNQRQIYLRTMAANVVKAEVAGKSNWAEFASKLKTGMSRFLPISMAEPEGQKTEYTGPC
jgi:hypothetical protein